MLGKGNNLLEIQIIRYVLTDSEGESMNCFNINSLIDINITGNCRMR